MVVTGQIARGREIGQIGCPRHKFIYLACYNCGKARWVQFSNTLRGWWTGLCGDCRARRKRADGYVHNNIKPDSPFYAMAERDGDIKEHRLMMARYLGRLLYPEEIVHHENGVKCDNRLENLGLFANASEHTKYHWELRREAQGRTHANELDGVAER